MKETAEAIDKKMWEQVDVFSPRDKKQNIHAGERDLINHLMSQNFGLMTSQNVPIEGENVKI